MLNQAHSIHLALFALPRLAMLSVRCILIFIKTAKHSKQSREKNRKNCELNSKSKQSAFYHSIGWILVLHPIYHQFFFAPSVNGPILFGFRIRLVKQFSLTEFKVFKSRNFRFPFFISVIAVRDSHQLILQFPAT